MRRIYLHKASVHINTHRPKAIMPLQHLPLTESDLAPWNSVKETAFATSLHTVMWPQGISPSTRTYLQNKMNRQLQNPNIRFFKVIDTDIPASSTSSDAESEYVDHSNIVGISKWEIHPNARSEKDLKSADAAAERAGYPPGMAEPFAQQFFGSMRRQKRSNLGGRAYINLHILAVLPEHRRRGVGEMLLRWGVEEGERRGLGIYLESSPMGKGLYERCGFRVLEWLDFDAREFRGAEPLWHACMLREVGGEDQERVDGEGS